MKFGYARVSTQDQNLSMQLDALNAAGVEKIYQEKLSGTKRDRPALDEMLKMLRPGDSVTVWKLDRIGRSMKHLIELIDRFGKMGVEFISLKENVNTNTATGKLIFNIFASLAEFERDMISERTKAGLVAARARGRKGGRPGKPKEQINLALKMYDSKEYTVAEIAQATGISKPTLYRHIDIRKQATK